MESYDPTKLKGTKRLFIKMGTCSRAAAFILNRQFNALREAHERALEPLAGGILQQGYQCGMLWGSSMAVGAKAFREIENKDKATALAIRATQTLLKSFISRTESPDCYDITSCDWTKKSSIAKYMVSGKVISCFKLLEKWAPEAIQAAYDGLSEGQNGLPQKCKSCATEVVRKMGGTEEESIMVAGFAGGIGLSGNACGALGAAIWMKTLALCKKETNKSLLNTQESKALLEKFYQLTDYKIGCEEITEKQFKSIDEHTEFIEKGGCKELISELASA